MSEPTRNSESLWQTLARAQEPFVKDAAAIERLRAAVVSPRKPLRRQRASWAVALAAVTATACGVLLVSLPTWRQPSFKVGGNDGAVGMVLAATEAALPVHFVDGSQVVLAPGARGRVNGLSNDGAEVVLSRGALEANVVHSDRTRWLFHAGPFEILVTGTRFVAAWQPETQTLQVRMREGSVRVSGGPLHQDVAVRAGQELIVSDRDKQFLVRKVAAEVTGVDSTIPAMQPGETPPLARPYGDATSPPAGPASLPHDSTNEVAPARAPEQPVVNLPATPPMTWSRAAAAGDHRRAFALAQRRGLDRLAQRLSAPDLLLLADTARYVSQPNAAAQAFTALVSRFPNSPEASDALFGLGRLSFEQRDWGQAADWFQRVVEHHVDGPLVEAAWGRLMEALDRAGDSVAAKAAARSYLQSFAGGQHRALAHRIRSGGAR